MQNNVVLQLALLILYNSVRHFEGSAFSFAAEATEKKLGNTGSSQLAN